MSKILDSDDGIGWSKLKKSVGEPPDSHTMPLPSSAAAVRIMLCEAEAGTLRAAKPHEVSFIEDRARDVVTLQVDADCPFVQLHVGEVISGSLTDDGVHEVDPSGARPDPCPFCHGAGEHDVSSFRESKIVECSECDGTGKITE